MEYSRDFQMDHNISAEIPALAVSDDWRLFFLQLFQCALHMHTYLKKNVLFKNFSRTICVRAHTHTHEPSSLNTAAGHMDNRAQ